MMFRPVRPMTALVVGAIVVLFCASSSRAADNPGTGSVQGVVKNTSGEALSGAYVKLFNAERHLTFMVISQAQGRYTANNLPPGKYTAQGIGGEFQSKAMPVDVTAAKPATADVSLTDQRAPENGWPGAPGRSGSPNTP